MEIDNVKILSFISVLEEAKRQKHWGKVSAVIISLKNEITEMEKE